MSERGASPTNRSMEIDMSSEAIDRRITRVAQLLDLCRELAEAKRVSDEECVRVREEPDDGREAAESEGPEN